MLLFSLLALNHDKGPVDDTLTWDLLTPSVKLTGHNIMLTDGTLNICGSKVNMSSG